jgi:hypothetical protein
MSFHGGAVAVGSPYLGSIFPVGMSLQTQTWAATHRADGEQFLRLVSSSSFGEQFLRFELRPRR